MSSGAIMALIKEKENILKKIQAMLPKVNYLYESLDCASTAFSMAGAAMEEAGTLDGRPFDNGKTTEKGQEFANLAATTFGVKGDINGAIEELESEIASLYQQYYAALAREEEERRRQLSLQSVYAPKK